jgi:hypothetical protein
MTRRPLAPWWAHFEFTRINIEPIILRKKIEGFREVSASPQERWSLPAGPPDSFMPPRRAL